MAKSLGPFVDGAIGPDGENLFDARDADTYRRNMGKCRAVIRSVGSSAEYPPALRMACSAIGAGADAVRAWTSSVTVGALTQIMADALEAAPPDRLPHLVAQWIFRGFYITTSSPTLVAAALEVAGARADCQHTLRAFWRAVCTGTMRMQPNIPVDTFVEHALPSMDGAARADAVHILTDSSHNQRGAKDTRGHLVAALIRGGVA
jgi:hypothetical protein